MPEFSFGRGYLKNSQFVAQNTAMFNNSTCSPVYSPYNSCCFDGTTRNQSSAFRALTLSTSIIVAILSPVAVVGNALIMAAVWRNHSLRTPSYILLFGLACTDLFTGLVTQPVHVAIEWMLLKNPQETEKLQSFLLYGRPLVVVCGSYFAFLSIILVILMSVERWLHVARRHLLTVRRCCIIASTVSVLLIPLVVCLTFKGIDLLNKFAFPLLLVCLLTTSIAYYKVYRVIRRHQQQVQGNESSENCGQPAINVAKYKKSVYTVLYIVVVFYITYVPSVVKIGFSIFYYDHCVLEWAQRITVVFLFLPSSVNPLIYLWRMKDIRNEVKLNTCLSN